MIRQPAVHSHTRCISGSTVDADVRAVYLIRRRRVHTGHCNDYWTEIDKCGMGECPSSAATPLADVAMVDMWEQGMVPWQCARARTRQ